MITPMRIKIPKAIMIHTIVGQLSIPPLVVLPEAPILGNPNKKKISGKITSIMASHHSRETNTSDSTGSSNAADAEAGTKAKKKADFDMSKVTKLSREEVSKKIKRNNPGSVPIILIPHGFHIENTKIILDRERMMFFLASWIYKNSGEIVYFAVDGAILKHHERIGHLYDRSASSDGYLILHVYKESPFG